MSRNFTTDVDTQREYFNATYFNNSGQNQIAKYDTTLLKPFFPNPDQWKLAINRMRVPLSGIPLTKNNIPFEQWQVGLYYQTTSSGENAEQSIKYVPQINPATTTQPKYFNIVNTNLNLYSVTNFTTNTNNINSVINSFTANGGNNFAYGIVAYDTLGPNGHLYVLDQVGRQINVYDSYTASLTNTFSMGTNQFKFFSITVDPSTGNLYVSCQYFVDSNNYIFHYGPDGTYIAQILVEPVPGSPTVNDPQIMYFNGYIYYTNNGQLGTYYFYVPVSFAVPVIPVDSGLNLSAPMSSTNNNCVYFVKQQRTQNTLILKYNQNGDGSLTLSQTYDTGLFESSVVVMGDDNQGNTLFTDSVRQNVQAYSFQSNQIVYTSNNFGTPPVYPIFAYPSPNETIPTDSGPYDIFTYQAFLNQINSAFDSSFQELKANLGASFLPTQPPEIVYNAQTKLFNLVLEGQYLTKNGDGSNQYAILMNNNFWSKFYFPSTDFQIGNVTYNSIILQNYGLNAIQGNGSLILPQFIYIQQEDSTIYSFYDLVRIIVGTTLIPVSGDGEGKTFSNTGFTSNSAINMITDIVPDTTTLTPGSILIYIPAGILRWYNLYAQQPFSRVDLILFYETKDGSVYPIEVVNGEFFSVKLEFKKGPGDF